MDIIINRLGINKRDLLDMSLGSDLAVRVTLMEANIINETKEWLSNNGISLDLENNYKPKSDKIIIIKNIP